MLLFLPPTTLTNQFPISLSDRSAGETPHVKAVKLIASIMYYVFCLVADRYFVDLGSSFSILAHLSPSPTSTAVSKFVHTITNFKSIRISRGFRAKRFYLHIYVVLRKSSFKLIPKSVFYSIKLCTNTR